MTDKKPDGGCAFPIAEEMESGRSVASSYGMSLRDYFAAAALQGMLSAHAIFIKTGDKPKGMEPPPMRKMTDIEISSSAYQYADAMLKAREQN